MSDIAPTPAPVRAAPSLSRALAGLGVVGVVASAVPLALAIHSVGGHHRDLIAVFGPIIGGAFIGTGLLAWQRRPDNRFGALMVALGFAYCLSGLIVTTESWSFTVGLHLLPLPSAILLHILVAFPTGRLLMPVYLSGGLVLALYGVWAIIGIAGVPQGPQETLERARVIALATVPFAFLAGLLRSRVVGAAAVSALVASLGDAGERRGRLRDALADALRDPSLELAFWLPERGGWVDEAGSPMQLPDAGSARTCTVIEHEGRPLAAIVHDVSLDEEGHLVRAVGGAASLALENERLDAELRANVKELRASRARIVDSADAARRRIERDLHDGAQQQLVAILLALRMARSRLDGDPGAAAGLLDNATRDLAGAIDELRELARGIHPAVLSDRGLAPALDAVAARMPIPVEIAATPAQRPPEGIEAAAYFVVAEALTNVTRYARASHARIAVTHEAGRVVVEVADDGVGGADPANGSGLRGLADRVAALDGRLEVDSEPGRGTTVRAIIPCAQPQPPLVSAPAPARPRAADRAPDAH